MLAWLKDSVIFWQFLLFVIPSTPSSIPTFAGICRRMMFLFLSSLDSFLNQLSRFRGIFETSYLHPFSFFQIFVMLKEMFDFTGLRAKWAILARGKNLIILNAGIAWRWYKILINSLTHRVIPAKAGIQKIWTFTPSAMPLDPRLRGDDELREGRWSKQRAIY